MVTVCPGCRQHINETSAVMLQGGLVYHQRCADGNPARTLVAARPAPRRDRLAAALLAFFLGGFGGHWFYLGRRDWGAWYLAGWLISWATTPILIGYLGVVAVGCLCLYDFVTLLSMDPAEFAARYD